MQGSHSKYTNYISNQSFSAQTPFLFQWKRLRSVVLKIFISFLLPKMCVYHSINVYHAKKRSEKRKLWQNLIELDSKWIATQYSPINSSLYKIEYQIMFDYLVHPSSLADSTNDTHGWFSRDVYPKFYSVSLHIY